MRLLQCVYISYFLCTNGVAPNSLNFRTTYETNEYEYERIKYVWFNNASKSTKIRIRYTEIIVSLTKMNNSSNTTALCSQCDSQKKYYLYLWNTIKKNHVYYIKFFSHSFK